ncbi:MAG: hypothetical protein PHX80_04470 [Candidatus Nanoarchaeia archaeon]|nr:hypothetical protein [Candidatus Nanoarchaeia archaeon]
MIVSVKEYLEAKFGKEVEFDCTYIQGKGSVPIFLDLEEALEEFAAMTHCINPQWILNPRSKEWILIDKAKGELVGSFKEKVPDKP